jgi:hypothetical protein
MSASSIAAIGPGRIPANSTTRIPASGPIVSTPKRYLPLAVVPEISLAPGVKGADAFGEFLAAEGHGLGHRFSGKEIVDRPVGIVEQHLGQAERGRGPDRASGEKKYYLANLPAATDLRALAATIKARWICEQAHQQLKEELWLDHFGRSWQGLHRHALTTMIAYAFLQHRRLAQAGRKKRINGPPPQPSLPAVRHAIVDLILRPPSQRCPYCTKRIRENRKQINLPKWC